MAKSPASEQFKLLELQSLDGHLKALDGRLRQIDQDPRIPVLQAALQDAKGLEAEAASAAEAIRQQLATLETEVAGLDTKIERDTARLNAGGLSKDLVALQKEIETLSQLKSGREDTELELMEELEGSEGALGDRSAETATAAAALQAVQQELAEKKADAQTERAGVLADRQAFAGAVDPGLLALYEKTLARRGVGAARLFHGHSEGSGMDLSPGDLAEVRAAAEDDVVYCPDSGVILVRSPEWN